MTADYEHLAPDCREEAALPDYERIRRIQAERWIGYPRAGLILNRLNDLLDYPQRDRMPCLLLYAATGMGKTKILRKFRREHPDAFDDKAGVQRSDGQGEYRQRESGGLECFTPIALDDGPCLRMHSSRDALCLSRLPSIVH